MQHPGGQAALLRQRSTRRSSAAQSRAGSYGLGEAKRVKFELAGENRLVEVELGVKQHRPSLRLTWGMSLVLEESRDVRRTSGAQRLGKALNGSCWYDGVVEAVGQEDGPVDLVHEVGGRAALVARKALGERPDEAVQLVMLELVRPPVELE